MSIVSRTVTITISVNKLITYIELRYGMESSTCPFCQSGTLISLAAVFFCHSGMEALLSIVCSLAFFHAGTALSSLLASLPFSFSLSLSSCMPILARISDADGIVSMPGIPLGDMENNLLSCALPDSIRLFIKLFRDSISFWILFNSCMPSLSETNLSIVFCILTTSSLTILNSSSIFSLLLVVCTSACFSSAIVSLSSFNVSLSFFLNSACSASMALRTVSILEN
ncbi:hypothetical protein WN66_02241 [Saccharomyces cerevisiae]|nr:hypothetical protein WN66_02241 [Saccharomyces cerevisiae]